MMLGVHNETSLSRRELGLGSAFSASFAVLVLFSVYRVFDPTDYHINGLDGILNDQAGYIPAGHWLAEFGVFKEITLSPVYADNPDFRWYMPGMYFALALSYKLFGFGVWQSLVPSIIGYVVSVVGTFLLGYRYYGLNKGLLAAFLLAIYPLNTVWAFTAMAESSFSAVTIFALVAIAYCPAVIRPFLMPLLLALPFLFRETAAALLLPAAWLVARDASHRYPIKAVLAAVATIPIFYVIYSTWFIDDGSVEGTMVWMATSSFNYSDATQTPVAFSAIDVLSSLFSNLERNWNSLVYGIIAPRPLGPQSIGVITSLALVLSSLIYGLYRGRRDLLPLSAGLAGISVLAALFLLYDVAGYKLIRHTLFVIPLLLVSVVDGLYPSRFIAFIGRKHYSAHGFGAAVSAATILCLGSWLVTKTLGADVVAPDAETRLHTEILESLEHDDRTLLVAPFAISLDYVVRHHPVRWSFVPANDFTLYKLASRYDIGTLVIAADKLNRTITEETIGDIGLNYERDFEARGSLFSVFVKRLPTDPSR